MIIHREYQQLSQEWLEAHCGVVTASEFAFILTEGLKPKTGETPKGFVAKKIAGMWSGPSSDFGSNNTFAMEQGLILEREARPWFEWEYGKKIEQVGFITTDDGLIGCSPDGLFEDESGIEIKCPQPTKHVEYLLGGILPPRYGPQVHGSMYVTGAREWTFVSYRRHFPPLVLTIKRDEEIQAVIHQALQPIVSAIKSGFEWLCNLNGGPPPKRQPMVFSTDISQSDFPANEPTAPERDFEDVTP